jgi:hypothetical protein
VRGEGALYRSRASAPMSSIINELPFYRLAPVWLSKGQIVDIGSTLHLPACCTISAISFGSLGSRSALLRRGVSVAQFLSIAKTLWNTGKIARAASGELLLDELHGI